MTPPAVTRKATALMVFGGRGARETPGERRRKQLKMGRRMVVQYRLAVGQRDLFTHSPITSVSSIEAAISSVFVFVRAECVGMDVQLQRVESEVRQAQERKAATLAVAGLAAPTPSEAGLQVKRLDRSARHATRDRSVQSYVYRQLLCREPRSQTHLHWRLDDPEVQGRPSRHTQLPRKRRQRRATAT